MYLNRSVWITFVVITLAALPLFTASIPLSIFFTPPAKTYLANHAFLHETGNPHPHGWEALYRIHRPGYLIQGLPNHGEILPEGTYRFDFYLTLRPGHLSSLLSNANDVIRLEVVDTTLRETLIDRSLQMADFKGSQKKYQIMTLTFSTWQRENHTFEPRVYWPGLSGVFLQRVDLVPLGPVSLDTLRQKADYFNTMMPRHFLAHGFVVARDNLDAVADTDDAAIWTGLYAAEEAWRYQKTGQAQAGDRLEQSLWAMHTLFRASPMNGTMARYIDEHGHPSPQAASKDTYTGFFYAMAQAYPAVRDPALRSALRSDLRAAATHFLDHDLSFVPVQGAPVDFNPYFSEPFVTNACHSLQDNRALRRQLMRVMRIIQWYFWIHGQKMPASYTQFLKTLKNPSETELRRELLPFLNAMRLVLKKLEGNIHQSALRGQRQGLLESPYGKLDGLLVHALANLDSMTEGKPLTSLSDLKILPSESLHALHILKVAAERLPKPNRFDTYYRANLYQGKALLKTAVQWHQFDEDLATAAFGKTEADTRRTSSAHLSFLALHDLILLEKDPAIRTIYQGLMDQQYLPMRTDGNAMIDAMQASLGRPVSQMGLALWSLDHYPVDRQGKGERFWLENRKSLLAEFGGEVNHQARDPLPPDLRPRDAFLWQRSAHSIRGDQEGWLYPPLDYLFAYWLAQMSSPPLRDNP